MINIYLFPDLNLKASLENWMFLKTMTILTLKRQNQDLDLDLFLIVQIYRKPNTKNVSTKTKNRQKSIKCTAQKIIAEIK
jgi:hypothetical protein